MRADRFAPPYRKRGPGLMAIDLAQMQEHGFDVGEGIARHGLFASPRGPRTLLRRGGELVVSTGGPLKPIPGTPGDEVSSPSSSSSSSEESRSSSSSSSESESESESEATPLPPKKKSKAKTKEIARALAALASAKRSRSRMGASPHSRAAVGLDGGSVQPVPNDAAKILGKLGIDDAAMARGNARQRLDAAIRTDDERALERHAQTRTQRALSPDAGRVCRDVPLWPAHFGRRDLGLQSFARRRKAWGAPHRPRPGKTSSRRPSNTAGPA